LITAGPTYEPVDPVRFIGNHSTGKMGYAIAEAFARQGAWVTLVSGPVSVSAQHRRITVVPVTTAAQMYDACREHIGQTDIAVFNAAVSDFTPETPLTNKMKRGSADRTIRLQPTRDIAAEMGKQKRSGQLFAGFALETGNGLENARKKLASKNLDLVVLNSLEDEGAGFGTETNKVTFVDKSGFIDTFEVKPKREVAGDIVRKIAKMMKHA